MKRKPTEKLRNKEAPLRLLTAVPICDGHDSAINTINLEFIRNGVEVVYLGYHRSAGEIVQAAVQEDVRAIGISSYNGGHVEFFTEVLRLLKKHGAGDLGVFGGGGGTITPADSRVLQRRGVDRIFSAGTPLPAIVEWAKRAYGGGRSKFSPPKQGILPRSDRELARLLSAVELNTLKREHLTENPLAASLIPQSRVPECPVIGITGPGGAGKTTLIDELVLRFLKARPHGRLAVLAHDPSLVGQGALLGDRAMMLSPQGRRVYMRSLATRGQAGGLAPATGPCLQILRRSGFDLVLVETVGVGQEALPFEGLGVAKAVLVLSPEYGSPLQLRKIAMLDAADTVVVNKADLVGARTAIAEIERRLAENGHGQKLIATTAKRHRDPGVDCLFEEVMS